MGSRSSKGFVLLSALLTSATVAHAASDVALFGVLDTGMVYRSNQAGAGGGGGLVALGSGFWSPSFWGIKGDEDIGGGTKVIFSLVSTINVSNGVGGNNTRMFDRNAYVGASNDQFGTVTLGRNYTPLAELFWATDPLRASNAATNMNVAFGYLGIPGSAITTHFGTDATTTGNSLDRQDNSIKYAYANRGVTAEAMYGFSGVGGNFRGNSSAGGQVGYDGGIVTLRGAAMQFRDAGGVDLNAFAAGGVVSLGTVQLRATWTQNKINSGDVGYANLKTSVYSGGVSWFVTPFLDLTLAYYRGQRTSDASPKSVANKGYFVTEYFLSKRTELIGLLELERFNANGATLDTGTPLRAGARSAYQIAIGIDHKF